MQYTEDKKGKKISRYPILYTLYCILVLSFLGFLDATYLTIQHYANKIPPCNLTTGCETVLTSKFATIGSIPVAGLGIGFYIAILILTIGLMQKNNDRHSGEHSDSRISNQKLFFLLLGLIQTGFVLSLVLFGIQAFILHAFCLYCLIAEGINTLLFILVLWITKKAVS